MYSNNNTKISTLRPAKIVASIKNESDKFPPRRVESISVKDLPSSESEEEIDLLKIPSTGSNFLLKSEQQKFQKHDLDTSYSKFFNVDTNMLNLALKGLSLIAKHDIEGIDWSRSELTQMEDEVKASETEYRDLLEKKLIAGNTSPLKQAAHTLHDNAKSSKLENDSASARKAEKDKESIQRWLDDVLDI